MKLKWLFLLCIALPLAAQTGKNDFSGKAGALQKLLTESGNLTWQWTDSLGYNEKITTALTEILRDKRSVKYDLDVLLKNDFLNIAHSDDKKLWIFGWHENTGGTFKNALDILQVRQSKTPRVFHDESTSRDSTRTFSDDENEFSSGGFFYTQIIRLKSKKQLYLCLGSVVGCSTCCLETAMVIELAHDSINFRYPAFATDSIHGEPAYEPIFTLRSRCGNIRKFDYDAANQTLVYEYETDDMTPIRRDYEDETDQAQIIRQVLSWDGERFTTDKE